MNMQVIERHFAKIGARAKVHAVTLRGNRSRLAIDVGRDRDGEFFDISGDSSALAEMSVVDVQPNMRHLLLMSRDNQNQEKHKFLCGHDERHWFVAAVPEKESASSVKTAFEALKPPAIKQQLVRLKVKQKRRNRRRNEAFCRQGEWFFVPVRDRRFAEMFILKNEPLRRGGGKPHMCEELVRIGGETVYVCPQYPNGLTEANYRKLVRRKPKLQGLKWRTMRRNPGVFVRGKVRHSDHKTIQLDGWHEVMMNTENQARAMSNVAFLD